MRVIKEQFDESLYYDYLDKHIGGVKKAYSLLCKNNICEFNKDLQEQINNHDKSKYEDIEFIPYGERFYGKDKNKKEDNLEFKYAWLHHQHNNPHHWQHWCLLEDNGGRKSESLEMAYNYVIEMICDWLSFSINKGDLSEIQKWYQENKSNQILHPSTKKLVEEIIDKLRSIKYD